MDRKRDKLQDQISDLKQDQKDRHEKEQSFVKEKWRNKLQLAKDKTKEEYRNLMDSSVDIDQHVRDFKKNLLGSSLEDEKYR